MKFFNGRDLEGAVLVEFSLIVTLLVLLLAGVTFFGVKLYQLQVVAGAARHGARVAAHRSNFAVGPGFCSQLAVEATAAARDYLVRANITDSNSVWDVLGVTADWSLSTWGPSGESVTKNLINVSIRTAAGRPCVFCFGRLFSPGPVEIRCSFPIRQQTSFCE